MKLPEKVSESSHRTNSLNTAGITGVSLLWGHMLDLISLWFLPLTIILLIASYGNELVKRKQDISL